MKLEFSPQIFEKYSNRKLNERWELSSCMRTDGQTDKQTDKHAKTDGWTDKQTGGWKNGYRRAEANSRLSRFCDRVNKQILNL